MIDKPFLLKLPVSFFSYLLLISLVICSGASFAQHRLTINLKVPEKNPLDSNGYYIASDLNKWNPADSSWRFLRNEEGLQLSVPFSDSITMQFKVTRGAWSSGESDADGYGAPNRKMSAYADTIITVNVVGWVDKVTRKHTASSNVRLLSDSFPMTALHSSRQIWVYLPPSYHSSKKRYPVIYMQDGQNLFDRAATSFGTEWKVDETMDSLINTGKKEYIIVGIASGEARLREYLPYESSQLPSPLGKEYAAFMAKELVPYIDKHYRTLKESGGRSVAGSSMGALISLYVLMEYPELFGSAGVFSSAFWVIDDAAKKLVKDTGKKKLKVFLYAGDAEMSSLVPETEKIKKALEFNPEIKVKAMYQKGGQHSEYYWQRPFLDYVLWIQQ